MASRIRPTLAEGSIVTDTRTNVMYVATEYGCVNLKGLSVWERAEALISIAHPDFRQELLLILLFYLVIQIKSSDVQPFIYFQF